MKLYEKGDFTLAAGLIGFTLLIVMFIIGAHSGIERSIDIISDKKTDHE